MKEKNSSHASIKSCWAVRSEIEEYKRVRNGSRERLMKGEKKHVKQQGRKKEGLHNSMDEK